MRLPKLALNVVRQVYASAKAPYQEGSRHVKMAFARSEASVHMIAENMLFYRQPAMPTKWQRVVHIGLGVALCLPIVNVIVYLACKIFRKKPATTLPTPVPAPAVSTSASTLAVPVPAPAPTASAPAVPAEDAAIKALRERPYPHNIDQFVATADDTAMQKVWQQTPELWMPLMTSPFYQENKAKVLQRATPTQLEAFFLGVDANGKTLLHLAVEKNSIDNVTLFLAKARHCAPAMLSAQDTNGRTPLHYAASQNSPTIMSLLLEYMSLSPTTHGALGIADNNGNNILHYAALRKSVFNILCKPGSVFIAALKPLCVGNKAGQTPLHPAAQSPSNEEMLASFFTLFPTEAAGMLVVEDAQKRTPIHTAAKLGCAVNTDFLIEKLSASVLSDILAKIDTTNQSFLHYAAQHGHHKLARLCATLLPGQVRPMLLLADTDGRMPLHYAAGNDNAEMIKFITAALAAEKAVQVFTVDSKGQTPLHIAAASGTAATMTSLVDLMHTADATDCRTILTKLDTDKRSLLHHAAMRGNFEILNALATPPAIATHLPLLYPADKAGRTPLAYALCLGSKQQAKWPVISLLFEKAPAAAQVAFLTTPTQHWFDQCSWNEKLPLHRTIEQQEITYMRTLFNQAKAPTARAALLIADDEGCNLLHHAARTGNLALITALIELMKPEELTAAFCADPRRNTPLTFALQFHGKKDKKWPVISLLFEKAPAAAQVAFLTTATQHWFDECCWNARLPLHRTVEQLETEHIRDLFAKATAPEARAALFAADDEGRNLLHHAARTGNLALITALTELMTPEELIAAFSADKGRYTPLDWTLHLGMRKEKKWPVISFLFEKAPAAAQVAFLTTSTRHWFDDCSHNEMLPLHRTVEQQQIEYIRDLLAKATAPEARAAFFAVDDERRNLLHHAARTGCLVFIQQLVALMTPEELTAAFSADRGGLTPLACVLPLHRTREMKWPVISFLFEKAPAAAQIAFLTTPTRHWFDEYIHNEMLPLHRTVEQQQIEYIRDLLSKATAPEARAAFFAVDDERRNLLHHAARTGCLVFIQQLVALMTPEELTASFSADRGGQTPLAYVLPLHSKREKKWPVISFLFEKAPAAAQIAFLTKPTRYWFGECSHNEMLPLHRTIEQQQIEYVRILFTKVAAPEVRTAFFVADDEGRNLLHHAAKSCALDAINALIKLMNIQEKDAYFVADKEGRTPFTYVINRHQDIATKQKIVQAFYQMCPKAKQAFINAQTAGSIPKEYKPAHLVPLRHYSGRA